MMNNEYSIYIVFNIFSNCSKLSWHVLVFCHVCIANAPVHKCTLLRCTGYSAFTWRIFRNFESVVICINDKLTIPRPLFPHLTSALLSDSIVNTFCYLISCWICLRRSVNATHIFHLRFTCLSSGLRKFKLFLYLKCNETTMWNFNVQNVSIMYAMNYIRSIHIDLLTIVYLICWSKKLS